MAMEIGMEPPHPGGFIKRSVLPDDLSVTAAAQALGVGRPALSNLLNEKASLSPEMALRLEKAFGVKMDSAGRPPPRRRETRPAPGAGSRDPATPATIAVVRPYPWSCIRSDCYRHTL